MKKIRTEITIQSTPEKVWQVLTNLDQYADWNPFLHHASGKIDLGKQVDVTFKNNGKDMVLHCIVTEVDRCRKLSWKYHVGAPFLYQGEHIFTLDTTSDGKVHFVDQENFTGLLVPFFVKENDTGGFISMDEALKKKTELN
jgi:hypothetical protein